MIKDRSGRRAANARAERLPHTIGDHIRNTNKEEKHNV